MVRISSAWMKAPAYVPPTDRPNPFLCRDFRKGSMISKKRAGERTEPWRTPRSRLNADDKEPFTLTIHFGDIYQLRVSLQALPSIPASYRCTVTLAHACRGSIIIDNQLQHYAIHRMHVVNTKSNTLHISLGITASAE